MDNNSNQFRAIRSALFLALVFSTTQLVCGCTIWRMLTSIKNPERTDAATHVSHTSADKADSAGEPESDVGIDEDKDDESTPSGSVTAKGDKGSADVDFGPYMANLQERIKRHWFPPKGQESRRVVVIFKIAADGAISDLKIDKSSGVGSCDKAALEAVRDASPFMKLPVGSPQTVDIQFTFDYNVFNGSKR